MQNVRMAPKLFGKAISDLGTNQLERLGSLLTGSLSFAIVVAQAEAHCTNFQSFICTQYFLIPRRLDNQKAKATAISDNTIYIIYAFFLPSFPRHAPRQSHIKLNSCSFLMSGARFLHDGICGGCIHMATAPLSSTSDICSGIF